MGNITSAYNYDLPDVQSLVAVTAPTVGGEPLTIHGANFGVAVAHASVSVGDQSCPVTAVAHTELVCTQPADSGVSPALVVVTVSGQSSINSEIFVYDRPSITSITPAIGASTDGSTTITIGGINFGPSTVTVNVMGVSCSSVQMIVPHLSITCVFPAGSGNDVSVTVTRAGLTSSTAEYKYRPATISSITPSSISTAGGDLIGISGSDFGSSGANAFVGDNGCTIVSQNHSFIRCMTPAGEGTGVSVKVFANGASSNLFDID